MVDLLQDWITRQAQHRPDAIAIVDSDLRVSWGELDRLSSQLARLLKDGGCVKGDRVCFLTPKSAASFVAMMGILKADCLYVPLDYASPASRLVKIVESCEPRWILSVNKSADRLDEIMSDPHFQSTVRVGWLDGGEGKGAHFQAEFSLLDFASFSGEPLAYQAQHEEAAHILFTSGSTGMPKGVIVRHSSVIHYIEWANKYCGTNSSDKIPCHPPLHFDLSTHGVYAAFAAGAELHLVPPELNLLPHKVAEFIRAAELTQWISVPSLLCQIARKDCVANDDFPSLKHILWCGEIFPTPYLMYWMKRLPHVRFTNTYGPTEATVASSFYPILECPTDEKAAIPIGAACDGEELLVLDEKLKPVPPEVVGDLYIRGVGLSPGYWRDPVKTAAAFLPNPHRDDPKDKIYKTGDLARIGADGLLYFLGRADTQVKSRGYRIELGEIEAALSTITSLKDGAIVAINLEANDGATICCAYVPREPQAVTPALLTTALRRLLPAYMVPLRWMAYDRLPQNGNGKIDRPLLQERFRQLSAASR